MCVRSLQVLKKAVENLNNIVRSIIIQVSLVSRDFSAERSRVRANSVVRVNF